MNRTMKIKKYVYDKLMSNIHQAPPEMGGILGGKNNCINSFVVDKGLPSNNYDEYIPNTEFLNVILSKWRANGIEFYGMFHTHFESGYTLSINDKKYICSILKHTRLKDLYFPIIVPQQIMIVYKANIENRQLILETEGIEYF